MSGAEDPAAWATAAKALGGLPASTVVAIAVVATAAALRPAWGIFRRKPATEDFLASLVAGMVEEGNRVAAGQQEALEANTRALSDMADTLTTLVGRLATIEGRCTVCPHHRPAEINE